MKTSHWFETLPDDHIRIGISRGIPRRTPGGYRVYRKLAPGPWFNSVSTAEYDRLYKSEILDPLNPHQVAAEIAALSGGRIPVLLCWEKPNSGQWCHRTLAARWLAEALGYAVPEFGFEQLPQELHPLMHPSLQRPMSTL